MKHPLIPGRPRSKIPVAYWPKPTDEDISRNALWMSEYEQLEKIRAHYAAAVPIVSKHGYRCRAGDIVAINEKVHGIVERQLFALIIGIVSSSAGAGKMLRIVPVSPFKYPATKWELSIDGRVFQVWNAFDVLTDYVRTKGVRVGRIRLKELSYVQITDKLARFIKFKPNRHVKLAIFNRSGATVNSHMFCTLYQNAESRMRGA